MEIAIKAVEVDWDHILKEGIACSPRGECGNEGKVGTRQDPKNASKGWVYGRELGQLLELEMGVMSESIWLDGATV